MENSDASVSLNELSVDGKYLWFLAICTETKGILKNLKEFLKPLPRRVL